MENAEVGISQYDSKTLNDTLLRKSICGFAD